MPRLGQPAVQWEPLTAQWFSAVSNIIQHPLLIYRRLLNWLDWLHLLHIYTVCLCVCVCVCGCVPACVRCASALSFQVAPSSSSPHTPRLSLQSVPSTAARPCQWVHLSPSPKKKDPRKHTHTHTHTHHATSITRIHNCYGQSDTLDSER